MNAKLIARVSTKKQDNEIRMTELRLFAKSKGYRIVGEYWIKESAAIDIEKRNEFMNALEEDRGEDIVILNKLDRLTRNFKTIPYFEEYLINAKFNLITIDHEPNLTNATGRFLFRQLLLMACLEHELMKERMEPKVEERKNAGGYKGRKKGAKNKSNLNLVSIQ